jgi:molybdopterin/thiamine biosynthesis adenylyltransferase/proteasome lid subunit RPN8/RPN11
MFSQKFTVTKEVYDRIANTVGRLPAETGGILGSSDGGHTVDRYHFDSQAHTTGFTYSPDTQALNRIIAEWNREGVELVGFVHSHPKGSRLPSSGDRRYVRAIMEALDVRGRFLMPIVEVANPPDGTMTIRPYVFEQELKLHPQELKVEPDRKRESENPVEPCDGGAENRFDRIKSLCPLEILSRKTAVCVGCGGTRGFIEELARSGVGNFVLMDGDTVGIANIATQQVYESEIGRNKAEVLRERILDINPDARVRAVPRFLDDSLTDGGFETLVGESLLKTPEDALICGCTDSFPAQARSGRLALKYGTSYLAAQLYRGGTAAEIYFSRPGVTRGGCPRCAMSSRYEAYASGYRNDVTSEGAPIFATTGVNAAKGRIALMLLLCHEEKSVYGDMLERVADRNFVMLRMRPEAGPTLGIGVFDEAGDSAGSLAFFDETLWIPQTPDDGKDGRPLCPLCGGAKDLAALKGKIPDTRDGIGKGGTKR